MAKLIIDLERGTIAVTGGVEPVDNYHNHAESVMTTKRTGQLRVILDTMTPKPGGGTFVGYDQDLSLRGGGLLFSEIIPYTFGALAGIYTVRNDGLGPQLVADGDTPVPGGSRDFTNFAGADWDGGEIAFVFQEPAAALDPVQPIGAQILEAIRRHRTAGSREAREIARGLLAEVSFPDPDRGFGEYPHRLSGGLKQRALLALLLGGWFGAPLLVVQLGLSAVLSPAFARKKINLGKSASEP
jgi:ABC-type dipeptide/oligopeptide/nickel transport system ATPase component